MSKEMQISRHWRLNSQRYRLEGVRYENGQVSLTGKRLQLRTENDPVTIYQAEKVVVNKPQESAAD